MINYDYKTKNRFSQICSPGYIIQLYSQQKLSSNHYKYYIKNRVSFFVCIAN